MRNDTWSHADYEAVARLIGERTGLEFSPNRFGNAEAGIRRAMERAGVSNVAEYLRLLGSGGLSDDDLIAELTVGETYFFRDPPHFEFLRATILPELRRANGPDHTLRAWSAGCATGEEPYSLAILCREEGLHDRAQILATDISRSALVRARTGAYRSWSLRALDERLRDRYFVSSDDHWELSEPILRSVRFEHLNLSSSHYPSLSAGTWGMDVIFCRNVLIYLGPDVVRHVGAQLIASLSEHGWLITGPSDPPLGDVQGCQAVMTPAGVFYRRRTSEHHTLVYAGAVAAALPPTPIVARPEALPTPSVASPSAPEPEVHPPVEVRPASLIEHAQEAMQSGDYHRALELIAGLAPSAAAFALQVRVLANMGRPELALQAVREGLRSHPLAVELQFLCAVLCMEGGALREAAQVLRRVIYLDRSLVVAHYTLGTILKQLGDTLGARRAYATALAQCEALPEDAALDLAEGERPAWLVEAANAQLALLEAER